jgi:broad specificity phosphatase PhoE
MQTAEPLAKKLGIEIITDIRLKETDHGKLANASSVERGQEIRAERTKIFTDKNYKFAETGESYADIENRMKEVVNEVCEKYPGKTVLIVSHGFPVRILDEYLTGKTKPNTAKSPDNAKTHSFILDVANKNLLNLHKPYIDSVLLKNPKATKAKKVLGVHGFKRTDAVVDFLE